MRNMPVVLVPEVLLEYLMSMGLYLAGMNRAGMTILV
jgi:hypothetical protein